MVTSKTPKTKAKSKLSLTDDEKRLVFNHVVKIKKPRHAVEEQPDIRQTLTRETLELRIKATSPIKEWFRWYLKAGQMRAARLAELLNMEASNLSERIHARADFPSDFEKVFFDSFRPVMFAKARPPKILNRASLTEAISKCQKNFKFTPKLQDTQGREILRILQRDLEILKPEQKSVILAFLKKCAHENYPEEALVIVQGGNKKRSGDAPTS